MHNKGFPIIQEINQSREELFRKRCDPSSSFPQRLGYWVGHKCISVISYPANGIGIGIGLIGMAVTTCTLGAFKVFTFAVTLGHIKPEFSIGFIFLAERTFTSLVGGIFNNTFELISDVCDALYQGYKGVTWVLTALRLDTLSKLIKHCFKKIGERVDAGNHIAVQDEQNAKKPSKEFLKPFDTLNRETSIRSCFVGNQSMRRWFEHKFLSVVNIPAQTAVALLSGVVSIAGAVAFCTKAILFAATNLHISLPTHACFTGEIWLNASRNAISNVTDVVADMGVLVFKIADSLYLTKAVVTALEIAAYIPKAIFS